jgi:hypothetical protein
MKKPTGNPRACDEFADRVWYQADDEIHREIAVLWVIAFSVSVLELYARIYQLLH